MEVVTDPRRIAFALVAALVISGAITFVFYMRVAKKQSHPSTTRIVVAAAPIEPGAQITADQLAEADWPTSVPMEGMIQKKEDVVGHSLIYAIAAKQPILQRDLASAMSYGLSAKIPSGMRATAVRTDEVANVAGFLFPGSHVDVVVSMPDETRSGQNVSRTVLQNVVVLSTGTKIQPDPNGKPEDVKVVTLLVSPEQSELLLLAQNQGRIQISLRNGDDQGTPEVTTVRTAQLLGAAPAAPVNPEVRHTGRVAAVKPAKPAVYTVETIAAGKVTTASFSTTPAQQ